MQDRVKDIFANSSNPFIIKSVSNILRISLQESKFTRFGDESTSSFVSTEDEDLITTSRTHYNALKELGMQGLAGSFQFLPPNRGHSTKLLQWIPDLVTLMISWISMQLDLQSISLLILIAISLGIAKSWTTAFLVNLRLGIYIFKRSSKSNFQALDSVWIDNI